MAKKKDRNEQGKFIEGNKAAEKWTESATIELLSQMWATLTDGHEDVNGNFVRANDIKTIQEVCLMHDIDPDTWAYLYTKHRDSPSVLRLIKKIKWVLEARLIYAGNTMDIFVLKNHYDYEDKNKAEVTGKDGQDLNKGYYDLIRELQTKKA